MLPFAQEIDLRTSRFFNNNKQASKQPHQSEKPGTDEISPLQRKMGMREEG